jgi:aminopeptidase YwaD
MISSKEFEMIREIKGRKELEHIRRLSKIGDRFVGTEGDRKAIRYIRKEFKALGLEVKETKIKVPTFIELRESVLRVEATGEPFAAIPPYFSPSTPEEGIRAEVAFVGEGEEEDYKRTEVQGKIVLILETGLGYSKFWLGTFAERAAQHGAVGLIVIHPMPWPYRMSMEAGNSKIENRFCTKRLPGVCISGVDGAKLMHHIGKGEALVYLNVQTNTEDRESVVLSGIKRGTTLPRERIGLIGHRDNGIAPGANDNLSGSGCQLEIARVMSKKKSKRSFEFISSTAEEGVTIGAWNYCQVHKEDLKKNMKALIDIDMVGVGGMVKQVERGLWPDSPPILQPKWLMKMVDEVAEDLGYYFGRMTAGWGVAESARFMEIGVPATWFWAPDDPYYHSVHDSFDKINPNSLKAVSDVAAIVMWRLANQ